MLNTFDMLNLDLKIFPLYLCNCKGMLFSGENEGKIIVTVTYKKCFHKEIDALISNLLEAIMKILVYTFSRIKWLLYSRVS